MRRLTALIWLLLWLAIHAPAAAQSGGTVHVASVQGVVNPPIAQYVTRVVRQAEDRRATLVVLRLDTPGGLASAMDEITRAIVNARVPVAVYVAPPGARAASAGLFITEAAHIAAMAPSTNLGSATPVSMGDQPSDEAMKRKVTNDAAANIRNLCTMRGRNAEWCERAVREAVNATAAEALELKVIDIVASDLADLLRQIDGREVKLIDRTVTLRTAAATLVDVEMSPIERFLHTISDPNVAFILMNVGVLGLIYELANPGAILPGVVGVIALLFGLYALGTLPVNFAGLALIVFAFALLLAEVKVQSSGILTVGGIVSLVLGGLMLFQSDVPGVRVSWPVLLTVTAFTGGFFAFAVQAAIRAQRQHVTTGREGLVGDVGVVRAALAPEGQILVHGELWSARTETGEPLPVGQRVRVLRVEGLRLIVRPEGSPAAAAEARAPSATAMPASPLSAAADDGARPAAAQPPAEEIPPTSAGVARVEQR